MSVEKPTQEEPIYIALIGNPNTGKTALFNALTGSRQKVGNYAGVTVERKQGLLRLPGGRAVELVDTPGIYSFHAQTLDENVACDVLKGIAGHPQPQVVIYVADATNLQLNFRFLIELKQIGFPIVVALNFSDLAEKRSFKFDIEKLSLLVGAPVVAISATSRAGVADLLSQIEDSLDLRKPLPSEAEISQAVANIVASSNSEISARYADVDAILKESVSLGHRDRWTHRLDKIFLHRVLGPLCLLLVFALVFQAVFSWSAPLQDAVEMAFSAFGQWVEEIHPAGKLRSLVVDGVIAGVGSVLVFLPQILVMFFFIIVLEDSGYMARAAFILDGVMQRVGLSSRSVLPFISGYACAIPGIMSARSIENHHDRLLTILLTPLMTCSARLPIYTLLIAAFIPQRKIFFFMELQALVLLTLYFLPLVVALLLVKIVKSKVLKSASSSMIMELPDYKRPHLRHILLGLYGKSKIFLLNAGTMIVAVMIVLWFVCTYPAAPEGATQPALFYSFAGKLGHLLEPVFMPLGFDWRMIIALIAGFGQREVVVAALGTLYALEGKEEVVHTALANIVSSSWPLATGLSLMAWYIFAPQCISTFAIVKRETNSWRWPLVMTSYLLALAYLSAFGVFQITSFFGKV